MSIQLCCAHIQEVEKKSGVYQIYSRARGEVYIGSTKNLNKRFRDHLRRLIKGNHPNYKLQKCFDRRQILFFRVVVFCGQGILQRIEQEALDRQKNNKHCLNRVRTAAHNVGRERCLK